MYDSHFSFISKYRYNRFIGCCRHMLHIAKSKKTVIVIVKKVFPSGQKFKAVIISSFAIRNPNLRPHKDIRDRANANDEIPLISCITYHTVKCFGLNDIEIRNGISIPHNPIVTSPAFPTELPSHSILGNGSK